MAKQRVLLICMVPLLCEGLQRIFEGLEDLEVVCLDCEALLWQEPPGALAPCLQDFRPDIVLITGQSADDVATHLISNALNQWPDVPVLWIEVATNIIRMYTSHTLPANSRNLIDAIRGARLGGNEDAPLDSHVMR